MIEDEEGFLYPVVDKKKCINCQKCEKICPILSPKQELSDLRKCFAAYNKNSEERNLSSSGGIFVALAKYVLNKNGVVFGAALDDKLLAYHDKANNEIELRRLIGSKYMQTVLNDTFVKVKYELERNINVLFCGNTCQIAGLRAYLGKKYENLICIDFICLGVPSPKIWNDYIKTFFKDSKITHVNFKDKSHGWHHFSLRIDKNNIEPFVKIGAQTYFFAGYFKGLYSRPVCHVCKFKYDENRISDITISDCWGSEYIAPEMDDNKGLSSIVCHSAKGLALFESIREDLVCKDANLNDVKIYNSGYCSPRKAGRNRNAFWKAYQKYSAEKVFKKYCKPEKVRFCIRILRKIKRILVS